MDAITAMTKEVERISIAMAECVSDSGYVKPQHRYRYYLLAQEHASFFKAIKWLEDLYHPAGRLVPDPHES